MMDELKQQFYEVMHKYQKPFSEEGVTANLTQWYEQKQGLLQLLRRHPLWNEKELAIVFRVEERREIDRATVDETRAAILELGRRACTDDTVYENFETALRASTADYARIPNEYRLDTIRQYGDIKCAPGQKASRIINRLCLKFHLDQIEEEAEAGEPDNRYMRTVKPYNALFARLADALNPAHGVDIGVHGVGILVAGNTCRIGGIGLIRIATAKCNCDDALAGVDERTTAVGRGNVGVIVRVAQPNRLTV